MENLPATATSAPAPALPKGTDSFYFNVQLFEHAQRVAKMFAASTMVPDTYRDNTGNCMIAFNLANRMNMDPFMLMKHTYIVHGKPGFEGKFIIALVNQSGRFAPLKFRMDGEGDDYGCTAYTTEKTTGDEIEGPKVTRKMVKEEGWTKNSKWRTMEDLMFRYRAASFFGNLYCPDLLMGMQSREELEDINPKQLTGVTVTEPETPPVTYEIQTPPPEVEAPVTNPEWTPPTPPKAQTKNEPLAEAPPPHKNFFEDETNWRNLRKPGTYAALVDHRDEYLLAEEPAQIEFKTKFLGLFSEVEWHQAMGTAPPVDESTPAPDEEYAENPMPHAPDFFQDPAPAPVDESTLSELTDNIGGYAKEFIEQGQFSLGIKPGTIPATVEEARDLLAAVHTRAKAAMPSIDVLRGYRHTKTAHYNSVIKRAGKPTTEEACQILIRRLKAIEGDKF